MTQLTRLRAQLQPNRPAPRRSGAHGAERLAGGGAHDGRLSAPPAQGGPAGCPAAAPPPHHDQEQGRRVHRLVRLRPRLRSPAHILIFRAQHKSLKHKQRAMQQADTLAAPQVRSLQRLRLRPGRRLRGLSLRPAAGPRRLRAGPLGAPPPEAQLRGVARAAGGAAARRRRGRACRLSAGQQVVARAVGGGGAGFGGFGRALRKRGELFEQDSQRVWGPGKLPLQSCHCCCGPRRCCGPQLL